MDDSPAIPGYFDQVVSSARFDPEAAFKFIGVRAFIMSASTMADLIDDFNLVLGPRFVDARLYMGGRRAGVRTARALVAAHILDPQNRPAIQKLFADFYAALGWGQFDFRLDYATRSGHVLVKHSFLAEGATAKFTAQGTATAVKNVATAFPRCAMLGGYIAGLVSNLLGNEVDVRETECTVLQFPTCRFEITPERLYVLRDRMLKDPEETPGR